MDKELELQGVVERSLFQSDATGFSIVKLQSDNGIVTLVGDLSTLKAGQQLSVWGSWVHIPNLVDNSMYVLIR